MLTPIYLFDFTINSANGPVLKSHSPFLENVKHPGELAEDKDLVASGEECWNESLEKHHLSRDSY